MFSSVTFVLFGGAIITAIDQFFKYKIRLNDGFYICNMGISFGVPFYPFLFWLTLSLFLIVSFLYFNYLIKNGLLRPHYILAFSLILGGASSNCLDRILLGCVFDYIYLSWKFLLIFNIADIAIFIGSCLLVFLILTKNTSKTV
jgi:lipoprotein signal peptidase